MLSRNSRRAAAAGVDQEHIDDADEAESPKDALIQLIVGKPIGGYPRPAYSPPPAPARAAQVRPSATTLLGHLLAIGTQDEHAQTRA